MNAQHNRIEIAGNGVGEVSEDVIQQRAEELARADGRSEAHEGDIANAKAELQGSDTHPPEVDENTENLTEWDTTTEASGHQVPRQKLDDEDSISVSLVEEGLEEADHDGRVAASELDRNA